MADAPDRYARYALGRLVLDYIRTFMWPTAVVLVVLVFQEDVRTILSEREVDIFGVRIGEKVEQIESQALAEIGDIRTMLETQQASGESATGTAVANDIETKLASLERNLSREIAEVQQAQGARPRPSRPPPVAPAPPPRGPDAAAAERRGFEALIHRDFEGALRAFEAAYAIAPEYHNVEEIRRTLDSLERQLSDPDSPAWPELHRLILTRYSWGMPEDLRPVFRRIASEAYGAR